MAYWVYEDDPTKRVRVHRGTCTRCNNGRGMKGSRLPDNRWHGPFTILDAAIEKALNTPTSDVAGCGHCLKQVGTLRTK